MHTLTWLRDRVLVRRQGRPDSGYPAASPELLTQIDEYLAARARDPSGRPIARVPVSDLDSLRMLEEAGVAAASYRTVPRRLHVYAQAEWRQSKMSGMPAAPCSRLRTPQSRPPSASDG